MLSDLEIEHFIRDGFVAIRDAFQRLLADEARELLWRDTGCDPQRPRTALHGAASALTCRGKLARSCGRCVLGGGARDAGGVGGGSSRIAYKSEIATS